jgi:hypothetical protein
MTRNVWLYLSMAASLTAVMVMSEDLRAQARDVRHTQVESAASPPESDDDTDAVAEFQRRLVQYDAVHRRLDASLPAQVVSPNLAEIIAIGEAHHEALRTSRHAARQGDMFFPGIARLFRRWIGDSLHGRTTQEFLVMITEEDARAMAPPSINGSYQHGSTLTTMPPHLLQILPRLPTGLEYRFMDRDLILWDPHANLIIDFIPHVLSPDEES